MKEIDIVFIDDDKVDLDRYFDIFEKGLASKFKITRNPITIDEINKNLSKLESFNPDAILVDYELIRPDSNNNVLGINGVSLSMNLRKIYSNIPIFLFTNTKMSNSRESNYFDFEKFIDEFLLKDDYVTPQKVLEGDFIKIIEGYKGLKKNTIESIDNLISILSLPKRNFELISEDIIQTLPKQLLEKEEDFPNYKVAKWIRKTLMNYPGILYDEIHSATFFGISIDSFNKPSIQEFFESAKYSGVFSNEKKMWWKSELIECANDFLDYDELKLPYCQGFQKGWQKKTGEILDSALCIYKNEKPAEWVCCVLNKPIMIKYTLRYLQDDRPCVMDESRISFKAIFNDNYNPEQIDPEARDIYENLLKKGE
ncbi:hypothetical protein F1737_04320 [Methanoplanus sp. FWC-SCC4]|uniref:Uncharacterized protein n=1 Tax=Methanochimaera problematica TaxID=2609417 RepID=A0AA97FAV1_9EURY|nr:hypothetical protein [Methanoplanus sp. FWC-SCC4]WOF15980.1 hypothetical protein F1737_04320 [Methanoplanus sp. FWC-SCC4]